MRRLFSIWWAVAFAMAAVAQESEMPDYGDFTVDAQVRSRGEFRTGLSTRIDGSEAYNLSVNDRVRLGVGWERKNLSMRIAAQHSGTWYDASQKNSSGKIALHEAWAKMTFGKGFFAQLGRQELVYDDERLFGAHDWDPTGRAHDAIRLGWGNTLHQVHAIASFNQSADVVGDLQYDVHVSGTRLYKNMQTLWYRFGADGAPFHISGLFSNQGVGDVSGKGVNYMQTLGTYMDFAKRKFFCDASVYCQLGSDRRGDDVRAFMMSANVGMQFTQKWRASIGDDYMSGSDGMPGTNRTFNLLYGSYHEFLGAMDYFGYGSIPTYGLNDLNAKAAFTPCQKFDMKMALHWFYSGRPINNYLKKPLEELTDPAKIAIMRRYNGKYRLQQHLGGELDIEASYRPWNFLTLRGGISMMIASESMQLFKGEEASTFQSQGWLSFDLNPTVFSTKHRRKL
ncbi:MAG: alginate export family protein [Bacteroidaceae bacterium]|nr:alginate export family protein [Bacteroidaceae bacterium]